MNPSYQLNSYNANTILEKAFLKARKNGYKFKNALDYDSFTISSFNPDTGRLAIVFRNDNCRNLVYDRVQLIFYDIEFAKAFFGSEWEDHIKKMTASPVIYDYLNEFLKEEENE